jgi:transcriptional repressor NrdR
MRCPYCNCTESQVKDSRPDPEAGAIRRRRICDKCGAKFTTVERVQLRDLLVKKSDGSIEPFDRDKLKQSIQVACRKRDISDDRIETITTSLHRQAEARAEGEAVSSEAIGKMVSESLQELDPIAFIRFASVYRRFSKAAEFAAILSEIPDAAERRPSESAPRFRNGKLF